MFPAECTVSATAPPSICGATKDFDFDYKHGNGDVVRGVKSGVNGIKVHSMSFVGSETRANFLH